MWAMITTGKFLLYINLEFSYRHSAHNWRALLPSLQAYHPFWKALCVLMMG